MELNKRKRRHNLFVIGVILVILGVTLLPFWNVTVEFQGNDYYTKEELLQTADLKEEIHLLEALPYQIEEKLKSLPYVKEVTIEYKIPYTLQVKVHESLPIG